jgi:magnesium chelatase family protein
VKGVLSIALEAKRRCRQTLIVPLENAAEAAVVEGVSFYANMFNFAGGIRCGRARLVVHFLRGDIALELVRSTNGWSEVGAAEQELDFGEVKGQQHVKRAVEVAAAGVHNILTIGPIPPARWNALSKSYIVG